MAAPAPHHTDETETDLVVRAQRADGAALAELYHRHAHPAWRLALAVGGSATVAEYAVTHGFTGALRRLRNGTTTLAMPFRLHVVRATGEVAASAARREGAPVDPASNDVVAAFRRLPERWRAALWLTAVEGGTAEQAAPILALSTEAAANLVARAEAGLRERYLRGAADGERLDRVADVVPALRALVVPMPDALEGRVTAHWDAWQREAAKDERHGLAAVIPLGPWAERAVAGAAAAVFAGGIACAIALSSKPSRGPELATPVSNGQLASGAANRSNTFDPFYGDRPTYSGGAAVLGSHVDAARGTSHVTTTAPSTGFGAIGGAAASTPTTPSTGTTSTDPSTGTTPTDPPATADATGVTIGTDVAGTPVAVDAGTAGAGATVGDTTVGTAPDTSSTGTTVTIDTGGVLPTLTFTL